MIKQIKANIPNTITCLNLLSGCIACIFAFHAQETFGCFLGYEIAFISIGSAAIFDFCDGAAARLLHAYSLLGKELDSLSDLISFGLAPAMLMYNTIISYSNNDWVAFVSLAIVVIGALRLAKFNIDDRQTTSFIGLPIPANAIFWMGSCAWIHQYGYCGDLITAIIILAISLLMVSQLRMFSLKFKNFNLKENIKRYVIIFATILFVIIYGIPGLSGTVILYILMSVFFRSREK